ncbi:MAG: serine/threonine-protein kinase [Acidobacteriota bacterium]
MMGVPAGTILLDRYRILKELGMGGMGTVYLAEDQKLEMPVAIKILRALLSSDPGSVKRLIGEAKASMLLAHPNIVRVHNFEDGETLKFLVMEYVEGETLAHRIAKQGKLEESEVRRIGIEATKGLEHAHSKKVIHRDLKPGNILLGEEDAVKIADFGIARVCRDSMSRLTSMQDSGTLLYMSPEQLAGKSTEASDLYSMGVVLYEMLNGDPPFCSGDIPYQIRDVAPEPLQGVSPQLSAIVLRCLAKKPEMRFAGARELREELEGNGAQPTPILPPEPKPTPPIPRQPLSPPPPLPHFLGPEPHPDTPKEIIAGAKRILIRQTHGNPELAAAVESELLRWQRLMVVSDIQSADLLLDLVPTSELNMWMGTGAKAAATLTSPKGLRLWSVVKGGEWSMAGWSFSKVAKAILQELRRFVDQYQ